MKCTAIMLSVIFLARNWYVQPCGYNVNTVIVIFSETWSMKSKRQDYIEKSKRDCPTESVYSYQ